MFTHKKETQETYSKITPVLLACDICKKEYFFGIRDDTFEIQEFIHIKRDCGYDSIFGDGERIELDICQNCQKEVLGKYIRYDKQL